MTQPFDEPTDDPQPPGSRRLKGMRFALVGAGRVGTSFAHWLVACGADPRGVIGRRPGDAGRALAKTLATDWYDLETASTAGLDLLLVTVADDALTPVARELAKRPQATVALHGSGSLDASALTALRAVGCAVGSCHPLRAFPTPLSDLEAARGTWFGLDGDAPALDLGHRLVAAWRGHPVVLEADQRAAYHLAASLAAGGVTTVLSVVEEVMAAADLPPSLIAGYLALTEGALAPIGRGETARGAITGPAARGDTKTLERHRRVLAAKAPELLPFFARLSAETRRQVAQTRPSEGPAKGDGTGTPGRAEPPSNPSRRR